MATTSVMGGAVRRREDPALIQGYGEYVDDLTRTGLLHVAFVRSPVARAKITSLDTSAAKAKPGVVAVFTHDDVAHLGPLLAQVPIGKLRPLLAAGQVNHVGEAVAMVVADTMASALDGAEAVAVDYAELPGTFQSQDAMAPGAPAIWDEAPDNIAVDSFVGNRAATDRAFAAADHCDTKMA